MDFQVIAWRFLCDIQEGIAVVASTVNAVDLSSQNTSDRFVRLPHVASHETGSSRGVKGPTAKSISESHSLLRMRLNILCGGAGHAWHGDTVMEGTEGYLIVPRAARLPRRMVGIRGSRPRQGACKRHCRSSAR